MYNVYNLFYTACLRWECRDFILHERSEYKIWARGVGLVPPEPNLASVKTPAGMVRQGCVVFDVLLSKTSANSKWSVDAPRVVLESL